MSEKCPECNCQLDLDEGRSSDCCCGKTVERRDGQLAVVGASADSDDSDKGDASAPAL